MRPLKCMQITFAVDQPAGASLEVGPVIVKKSELKPRSSIHYHDTVIRRICPSTRSTASSNVKGDGHTNTLVQEVADFVGRCNYSSSLLTAKWLQTTA